MRLVEQLNDGAIAIALNMMRELVGTSPNEVRLSRQIPDDIRPYQRCFGSVPRFNAEQNALVFPASLLARPVLGADRELRRILAKSVAEYWAVKQPSAADRVARILCARAIFHDDSLEDVARDLSMHPRTLKRRLQGEGTSFRRLLSQVRLEVARKLLRGTRIDVTNIALALGYADSSGFTHAFRRWCGKTPSEWRDQN